jgi:endonuclease YncB( thermonuclease family)
MVIFMRIVADRFFLIMVLVLCGASAYFTVEISKIKESMKVSAANLHITSGQKGMIKKIIDGDEVLVESSSRKFNIRILGISSFDPTLNDPLDKSAGESAVFYLQKMILNNEIEIVFDEYKVDSNDRVLAYIHKNSVDIGEDMVNEGLTLVYTKYPFSRITKYLRTQKNATDAKKGLWSNPRLEKRSLDLLKLWDNERK